MCYPTLFLNGKIRKCSPRRVYVSERELEREISGRPKGWQKEPFDIGSEEEFSFSRSHKTKETDLHLPPNDDGSEPPRPRLRTPTAPDGKEDTNGVVEIFEDDTVAFEVSDFVVFTPT